LTSGGGRMPWFSTDLAGGRSDEAPGQLSLKFLCT